MSLVYFQNTPAWVCCKSAGRGRSNAEEWKRMPTDCHANVFHVPSSSFLLKAKALSRPITHASPSSSHRPPACGQHDSRAISQQQEQRGRRTKIIYLPFRLRARVLTPDWLPACAVNSTLNTAEQEEVKNKRFRPPPPVTRTWYICAFEISKLRPTRTNQSLSDIARLITHNPPCMTQEC